MTFFLAYKVYWNASLTFMAINGYILKILSNISVPLSSNNKLTSSNNFKTGYLNNSNFGKTKLRKESKD